MTPFAASLIRKKEALVHMAPAALFLCRRRWRQPMREKTAFGAWL
jgi:hypothetical protein